MENSFTQSCSMILHPALALGLPSMWYSLFSLHKQTQEILPFFFHGRCYSTFSLMHTFLIHLLYYVHSMLIQGEGQRSQKVRFKLFIVFINSHKRNSNRGKRETSRFKFSYSYKTEQYWSIVNTTFYSKLNIRQWRNIPSNMLIK